MRMFTTKTRKRNASIKEYKCVIRIECGENSYQEISRKLNSKFKENFLDETSFFNNENYTEHHVKQQFSHNILKGGTVRIFITDYQENPLRSAISFTLFAIAATKNYDEIHDILQTRLENLANTVNCLLGNTYPVHHSLTQSGIVAISGDTLPYPFLVRKSPFWLAGALALLAGGALLSGLLRENQDTNLKTIVKEELYNYKQQQNPARSYSLVRCPFCGKSLSVHLIGASRPQ